MVETLVAIGVGMFLILGATGIALVLLKPPI
jgi:hypothetical protein